MDARRQSLSPRVREPLLLALLAAVAIIGFRFAGLLEFVELAAYDVLLRHRAEAMAPPPPVTLVSIREEDIEALGYPLSDEVLADVLEALLSLGPRVVGVDLYRDREVPPGGERLAALIRSESRLVLLEKFGTPLKDGVLSHPAASPEQVGFSDFPLDPGGLVRRGLLYLWDDEEQASLSLALRLALKHAASEGIRLGPDPTNEACVLLGQARMCPLGGSHGGYFRADARGFQYQLDYRDGRRLRASPSHSVTKVLEGRVDPASIRDRTVILGTAAASVQDWLSTPISEGLLSQTRPLYGIEVQGHAVSQLVRYMRGVDVPLRAWSEPLEAGWIVLWALLGAAAAFLRSLGRVASLLAGGLLLLAAAGAVAFAAGWWIPIVPAGLAWGGSVTLVLAQLAWRDHQMNEALVRMVGPEVAAEISSRPDQLLADGRLRPRLVTMTVLMSDLEGFTRASARMDPLALMEWLNEYMNEMSRAIESHGGVVDAYIGDGIKADFGVASAEQDAENLNRDAENAVEAALAMAEALERLNASWRERALPQARMRVGINTGTVTVGSFGAGSHIEYACIGETVNEASRLESFRKDEVDWEAEGGSTRILLSGRTLLRLGGRHATKPLGEFQLRGISGSVEVHRVIRSPSDERLDSGRRNGP